MPHGLLGHYAGFVSRFMAFVVDMLTVIISVSAAIWVVVAAWSLFQLSALAGSLGVPEWPFQIDLRLVTAVLTTGFFAIYNLFFWATTGRTPGKALMGLRVVTTDGKRVSSLRALLRLIGYVVSALPLFLGFLWSLIDDRRQGLHDKLADTCVVYTWTARPDERFLAYQLERLAAVQDEEKA